MDGVAYLIGNGKSREDFDLEQLRGKGIICGCNALYRDFMPDILFSDDPGILQEIRNANLDIPVITRKEFKTKSNNCIGIFGLRFILEIIQPETCYMLGMDFLPGNVYFGTAHYRNHLKKDWSRETRCFVRALKDYGRKVEVVNVNSFNPVNLSPKVYNYRRIQYREFKDEISTIKRSPPGVRQTELMETYGPSR